MLDITRGQELDMPNEVTIVHASTANAYQQGAQYARRRSGYSSQKQEIELAIAMTPERALRAARVLLYSAVAGRDVVKWTTNMRHSKLGPSDVVRLNADGLSLRVCIKEVNNSQNLMEFVGETDNARAYEQGGEAAKGNAELSYFGDKVRSIAISIAKVYDLPRLEQSDPSPVAYASLIATDGTFTGAGLYIKKPEGGYRDPIVVTRPSTCGITLQALAAPAAGAEAVDEVSTVDVELGRGQTLSSCTREQMLAGANLALIGSEGMGYEILNFQNADLIAEDTYRLSKLYRARKNTFVSSSKHLIYDDFLLLATAVRIPLLMTDIGIEKTIYAVTYGAPFGDATSSVFKIKDGGSLGPSAPPMKIVVIVGGVPLVEGADNLERRPTFKGTGNAGDYVDVFPDVTAPAATRMLISGDGTWSFTPESNLAYGTFNAGFKYMRNMDSGIYLTPMSPVFSYTVKPVVNSYRYFRFNVTANYGGAFTMISDWRFYDSSDVLIPVTTVAGDTATADSYYVQANYFPKNAFDNSQTSIWATDTALPHWLMIDFGVGKKVARIVLQNGGALDGNIKNFTIQGSNDKTNWTLLATVVGAPTSATEYSAISVPLV